MSRFIFLCLLSVIVTSKAKEPITDRLSTDDNDNVYELPIRNNDKIFFFDHLEKDLDQSRKVGPAGHPKWPWQIIGHLPSMSHPGMRHLSGLPMISNLMYHFWNPPIPQFLDNIGKKFLFNLHSERKRIHGRKQIKKKMSIKADDGLELEPHGKKHGARDGSGEVKMVEFDISISPSFGLFDNNSPQLSRFSKANNLHPLSTMLKWRAKARKHQNNSNKLRGDIETGRDGTNKLQEIVQKDPGMQENIQKDPGMQENVRENQRIPGNVRKYPETQENRFEEGGDYPELLRHYILKGLDNVAREQDRTEHIQDDPETKFGNNGNEPADKDKERGKLDKVGQLVKNQNRQKEEVMGKDVYKKISRNNDDHRADTQSKQGSAYQIPEIKISNAQSKAGKKEKSMESKKNLILVSHADNKHHEQRIRLSHQYKNDESGKVSPEDKHLHFVESVGMKKIRPNMKPFQPVDRDNNVPEHAFDPFSTLRERHETALSENRTKDGSYSDLIRKRTEETLENAKGIFKTRNEPPFEIGILFDSDTKQKDAKEYLNFEEVKGKKDTRYSNKPDKTRVGFVSERDKQVMPSIPIDKNIDDNIELSSGSLEMSRNKEKEKEMEKYMNKKKTHFKESEGFLGADLPLKDLDDGSRQDISRNGNPVLDMSDDKKMKDIRHDGQNTEINHGFVEKYMNEKKPHLEESEAVVAADLAFKDLEDGSKQETSQNGKPILDMNDHKKTNRIRQDESGIKNKKRQKVERLDYELFLDPPEYDNLPEPELSLKRGDKLHLTSKHNSEEKSQPLDDEIDGKSSESVREDEDEDEMSKKEHGKEIGPRQRKKKERSEKIVGKVKMDALPKKGERIFSNDIQKQQYFYSSNKKKDNLRHGLDSVNNHVVFRTRRSIKAEKVDGDQVGAARRDEGPPTMMENKPGKTKTIVLKGDGDMRSMKKKLSSVLQNHSKVYVMIDNEKENKTKQVLRHETKLAKTGTTTPAIKITRKVNVEPTKKKKKKERLAWLELLGFHKYRNETKPGASVGGPKQAPNPDQHKVPKVAVGVITMAILMLLVMSVMCTVSFNRGPNQGIKRVDSRTAIYTPHEFY